MCSAAGSGASVSGSTVTLTTSAQSAISYTVTCAAGNVTDLAGNGNAAPLSATFTGTDGIAPTVKACIDGLRDAGVIADDDTRHMTALTITHGGVDKTAPRLILTIEET